MRNSGLATSIAIYIEKSLVPQTVIFVK